MFVPPVAAVSGGGLIVISGLVFESFVPSLIFVAVSVVEPATFTRTLNEFVPFTSAALGGGTTLAFVEITPTTSVAAEITFQFVSTALTVMVNGVCAYWVMGVPVFPVELPGAAVSPGTSSCSLEIG